MYIKYEKLRVVQEKWNSSQHIPVMHQMVYRVAHLKVEKLSAANKKVEQLTVYSYINRMM